MGMIRIEEVGQKKLDRVNLILSRIPGGAQKALNAALKRAADSGKTQAAKYASAIYNISQGSFKSLTNISASGAGGAQVTITYAGSIIPLTQFHPSGGQQGGVSVSVKRGGGGPLPHAWLGNGYGYGVWERVGSKRFPIEQKYALSTAQMMQNEEVSDPLADQIQKVFDSRIEHEITRILNGW